MKCGPFPMWPAFPTSEYYDPLRLPLDRPSHFPGSPVIGRASLPTARRRSGSRRLSWVPTTTVRTFNAQYAGGFLSAHSWTKNAFRGLRRERTGSAPSLSRLSAGRLTTLTQASLTLQTARSLRPASHPASRLRTGASLPGTQASPRTGLTPAGHRELIAPTSCGPPSPHGAGAVPAHSSKALAARVSFIVTSSTNESLRRGTYQLKLAFTTRPGRGPAAVWSSSFTLDDNQAQQLQDTKATATNLEVKLNSTQRGTPSHLPRAS
jgi:hypothetical protein